MSKKHRQQLEFAEAAIGRPLKRCERMIFLTYCELLEEKPDLQLVMARKNGYSSALARIAIYERLYSKKGRA